MYLSCTSVFQRCNSVIILLVQHISITSSASGPQVKPLKQSRFHHLAGNWPLPYLQLNYWLSPSSFSSSKGNRTGLAFWIQFSMTPTHWWLSNEMVALHHVTVQCILLHWFCFTAKMSEHTACLEQPTLPGIKNRLLSSYHID